MRYFCRPSLTVINQRLEEEKSPPRYTDSSQHYLTSTTSGLGGSNYTMNTSGPSSLPSGGPTPSPRRKSSTPSFLEYADLPEEKESKDGLYIPGDYLNYPKQNTTVLDNDPAAGYFGKIADFFLCF
jgi:hypothetical protein